MKNGATIIQKMNVGDKNDEKSSHVQIHNSPVQHCRNNLLCCFPYQSCQIYCTDLYLLLFFFQGVVQLEKKLGAILLDTPKQALFQDGGNNLCLAIEDLSCGWRSKLTANYQVHRNHEVPFCK